MKADEEGVADVQLLNRIKRPITGATVDLTRNPAQWPVAVAGAAVDVADTLTGWPTVATAEVAMDCATVVAGACGWPDRRAS